MQQGQRKPSWLKQRLPTAPEYEVVRRLIKHAKVNTVCQEARCPNQWECFSKKTATFLILGNICTRNCGFCAVKNGIPPAPDINEPKQVALAAFELGLKHVVITSVTRDDLRDGGARHFADTIREIRKRSRVTIEILIPDFQGNIDAIQQVISAQPDVINHNIETVPCLYPLVRPQAKYRRSLELLSAIKKQAPHIPLKSGLMLGLGERKNEVEDALHDLYETGCRSLTLGQYLQPSKNQLQVNRYIPPEEFEFWKDTSITIGFTKVASAPFVRSSYRATI